MLGGQCKPRGLIQMLGRSEPHNRRQPQILVMLVSKLQRLPQQFPPDALPVARGVDPLPPFKPSHKHKAVYGNCTLILNNKHYTPNTYTNT